MSIYHSAAAIGCFSIVNYCAYHKDRADGREEVKAFINKGDLVCIYLWMHCIINIVIYSRLTILYIYIFIKLNLYNIVTSYSIDACCI